MEFSHPLMENNITRNDLDAVIHHLQQDEPRLTQGPAVKKFEDDWSEWLGVKHSLFVNSGSSANLLSMAVLRLKHPEGGKIIVPPITWVSDVASVIQNGFEPLFVDVEFDTLSLNTELTLKALDENPDVRAVFLTHCQGFSGLTDDLLTGLQDRNIPLIEDVCEAHGARHNGSRVGSFGWISNFSFYFAHHMSTIEGGMICTNDDETYQHLRMMRSHGMVREASDSILREDYERRHPDLNPKFIFAHSAWNVRNTELGGVLGSAQLPRLQENIDIRNRNWNRFLERIDSSRFRIDFKMEGCSNYAFNLICHEADETFTSRLMSTMDHHGIEYRRGSAGGGNQTRQPYLKNVLPSLNPLDYPVTDHIHFHGFYLGNYPSLSEERIDRLVAVINAVD